jgi:hypothetical protein
MGEMRNANILIGKPSGKRTFERLRRRCEDNIRMNLREIRWAYLDWIYLAQDRTGPCECGNESSVSVKDGEFLD